MVTLYLITGPPAAGKSTWVREHAKHGDITIDYDALAECLTPTGGKPHDHPPLVKAVTKAARQAAIDAALRIASDTDVYVIHSSPSDRLLAEYVGHGARVITIDPGRAVTMARCKAERPWRIQQAAKEWYRSKLETPTSKHDATIPPPAAGADTTRQW